MARPAFSSIRSRLTVLILLVVLPAFALVTYRGLEARRDAATNAREASLRTARLAASRQEQLIESAHQLLFSIAQLPTVRQRDVAACDELFAMLLNRYPRYANIGLIGADGLGLASGLPLEKRFNFAEDQLFQRCLQSRDFVVGGYQIGQLTHRPVVVFGFPVIEPKGEIGSILFASLDLAWLSHFMTEAQLPAGSVMVAVDHDGTVLAHSLDPEKWVGQPFHPASMGTGRVDQRESPANVEVRGFDGIARLYSFVPLPGPDSQPAAYVMVGIPTQVVYAEAGRKLRRDLLWLGLAAAITLVLGWIGSRTLILRTVSALVEATTRMRAGDLSARTGLKYGSGEVGHLARAFDDMAGSLEVRIAESEAARVERERLLEREQIARTEAEVAQERVAHILERVTDGFVALDTQWCYTYVNQRAGELFQRAPDGLVGKHIWTEFPEGVGQPFYDAYYKAVAEQASLHIEAYYAPWDRWFENRIYPSKDGLTIYFHEITERRRAEEQLRESSHQLRALSAHLQSIREDERARIAREIHDELGQALTGLKMDVSWLDARLTKEGEVEREGCLKKTSAMSKLIMSTIQSVRRIATELRPGILDDLGIVAAVEWQAQDFQSRTGISCSFATAIEDLEVDPERSTAIFRIAQETLTNVARHSGASSVNITLKRQKGSLILEVSDNGRGISAGEASGASSLGLLGMRERAAGLGGHLKVEARPDQGTRVVASIPLG